MPRARTFDLPEDRHYDKVHHLWARHDAASGRVRIGVDAIGLASLGDLAYVGLHATGKVVRRGEAIGALEAAKMTSAIAAPVSGTIVVRNDRVLADPMAVNRDPYGAGWLLEIEPAQWPSEAAALVSGSGIAPWAAAEAERLQREERADESSEGGAL